MNEWINNSSKHAHTSALLVDWFSHLIFFLNSVCLISLVKKNGKTNVFLALTASRPWDSWDKTAETFHVFCHFIYLNYKALEPSPNVKAALVFFFFIASMTLTAVARHIMFSGCQTLRTQYPKVSSGSVFLFFLFSTNDSLSVVFFFYNILLSINGVEYLIKKIVPEFMPVIPTFYMNV